MKSSSILVLRQVLIGKIAKANHPITCLNPEKTFTVHDVKYDNDTIWIRGRNTCWFGSNSYEIL